jgi:CTP-dependent riboflavin kinase
MAKIELLAALQELARAVDGMHASDEVTRALVKAGMANKVSDAYRRARRVIRAAQIETEVV